MVSGGAIGTYESTAETQVLVEGEDIWSYAEPLPLYRGLAGHKGISLNNHIFIIGTNKIIAKMYRLKLN